MFDINKLKFGSGFIRMEVFVVIFVQAIFLLFVIPKYCAMVEKTKSVEAAISLKSIQKALDWCYAKNDKSYNGCSGLNTWEILGIENPSDVAKSHFQYVVTTDIYDNTFTIRAFRIAVEGGNLGDVIQLKYDKRIDEDLHWCGTGFFGNYGEGTCTE